MHVFLAKSKWWYCRAYGDYTRRGLDWQLHLLDSAQLHNCDYTLQFTVRHTHTNLLSTGVCSLVVTYRLSHNSSRPRTSCGPTHSFRTVDSLSPSFLLSCSARGLLARARNLLHTHSQFPDCRLTVSELSSQLLCPWPPSQSQEPPSSDWLSQLTLSINWRLNSELTHCQSQSHFTTDFQPISPSWYRAPSGAHDH
jgi:hypothetical protein